MKFILQEKKNGNEQQNVLSRNNEVHRFLSMLAGGLFVQVHHFFDRKKGENTIIRPSFALRVVIFQSH